MSVVLRYHVITGNWVDDRIVIRIKFGNEVFENQRDIIGVRRTGDWTGPIHHQIVVRWIVRRTYSGSLDYRAPNWRTRDHAEEGHVVGKKIGDIEICDLLSVGDVDRAVRVLELPYRPMVGVRWSAKAVTINQLRERALRMAKPDSLNQGRLLSVIGRFRYSESGYQEARTTLDHALDIARREKDRSLEARALLGLAQIERAGAALH